MNINLDDYFLGHRPWYELQDFMDYMPRAGAYCSAIADDDEIGDILARSEKLKPQPPALYEWGLENEQLARISDLVSLVSTALGADFQESPRPVTALDRAEKRISKEKKQALEEKLGLSFS